ncbi:hypothetical protein V2J09_020461 [Rumex salicifolius]
MVVASAVVIAIGTSMASGLLKSVMEKCADAVFKSDSAAGLMSAILGGSLKPQLLDLQRELTRLNALLCAADQSQHRGNDLVLLWIQSIRKAVNFADHLLEDISYERMRRKAESNLAAKLVSGSSDGSLKFRAKMSSKLTEFKSMAGKIYEEASEIGLKAAEFVAEPSRYQPPAAMSTDLREIRENVDTSLVVGRQADEDFIVGELCRPNNDKVLRVIAIVGMSGVGKTTLARKIYDNETIRTQFKKRTWIFVSEDFNLRRVLDEMLQSLTGNNQKLSNTDAMVKKLQDCLEKERYLIVLDDVWNTDKQIWDSIRASLLRITEGCTLSTMVVTSQRNDVPSVMGASLTHQLKILPPEEAWDLFEKKALANRMQAADLRGIGERIVRKCGGLPLAISTLGSLLASMQLRSEWEEVEKSEVWDLPQGQNNIMPWLLLSFNHLPSASAKQCFAYCSVGIRSGTYFNEQFLTEQWVAQGFIQPSKTGDKGTQVDLGRENIKSMLANGLLQYTNDVEYPFSMHELIHDLALYVSRDTCLIIKNDRDVHNASSGLEHLLIEGGNACNSHLRFLEANTQCTLHTLRCERATTISLDLVAQARFLRKLILVSCGIKEIPRSIGRLKHLRILELKGNPFKYLPESIGRLYSLQIIDLIDCDRLVELPQTFTKLLNLRDIYTTKAVHIPKGMGQMVCLETLPIVRLKKGGGSEIKELRSLLRLCGNVILMQLENISRKEDATGAGLNTKAGITLLELKWTSSEEYKIKDEASYDYDEEVMEGLKPHSKLKTLWVVNFRGKRFSPWLSNGLYFDRLVELRLVNCKRCERLPTLGGLPCLETLVVIGMKSVEVIGSNFYQADACSSSSLGISNLFPSLKTFQLSGMPKLKDWFDPYTSAFPCLEKLDIENCPSLVSAPSCFHSLKALRTQGMNSGQPLLTLLSNSPKLTSLVVENVQQLIRLSEPLLICTSLQYLKIVGCQELVELPPTLQSLRSLEKLEIGDCCSLTSFPDIGGLSMLKYLNITRCFNITDTPRGLETCVSIERLSLTRCTKLNDIPDLASLSCLRFLSLTCFSMPKSVPLWLNHLSSLHELCIGVFNKELESFCGINHLPKCIKILGLIGWPKLKSLPDDLQSLTQLEGLRLVWFDGVIQLPEWLGYLSSLQTLRIEECKTMKQLPSSAAMQSLTQLKELHIEKCPLLVEMCSKGGDEWHKISHIPCILINKTRVT